MSRHHSGSSVILLPSSFFLPSCHIVIATAHPTNATHHQHHPTPRPLLYANPINPQSSIITHLPINLIPRVDVSRSFSNDGLSELTQLARGGATHHGDTRGSTDGAHDGHDGAAAHAATHALGRRKRQRLEANATFSFRVDKTAAPPKPPPPTDPNCRRLAADAATDESPSSLRCPLPPPGATGVTGASTQAAVAGAGAAAVCVDAAEVLRRAHEFFAWYRPLRIRARTRARRTEGAAWEVVGVARRRDSARDAAEDDTEALGDRLEPAHDGDDANHDDGDDDDGGDDGGDDDDDDDEGPLLEGLDGNFNFRFSARAKAADSADLADGGARTAHGAVGAVEAVEAIEVELELRGGDDRVAFRMMCDSIAGELARTNRRWRRLCGGGTVGATFAPPLPTTTSHTSSRGPPSPVGAAPSRAAPSSSSLSAVVARAPEDVEEGEEEGEEEEGEELPPDARPPVRVTALPGGTVTAPRTRPVEPGVDPTDAGGAAPDSGAAPDGGAPPPLVEARVEVAKGIKGGSRDAGDDNDDDDDDAAMDLFGCSSHRNYPRFKF